ncbi:hypothetical protein BS47DRAFT_1398250 [Hydnum rufescens UP504]|uniref:Uncharacterized protein n=1 Tax=Hydnum rufescens UP504 TaxID=1448309 RepID=A0A9P6ALA9_9AGAM|nr:hypothetical protein BS47DRAFT_1398250 [Hydnum rufescens UP504]
MELLGYFRLPLPSYLPSSPEMPPRFSATPSATCSSSSLGPIATEDPTGFSAIKKATAKLAQAVIHYGRDLTDSPMSKLRSWRHRARIKFLYGANVPILKSLRSKYDPMG